MRVKAAIAASVGTGLIGLAAVTVGTTPAAATDRPTKVAFVRVWHNYNLHRDGSLSVGAGVRCVPGWQSVELDVLLHQGGVEGDGFTVPTVVCDNSWHPVVFTMTDVSGAFHAGNAHVSAQFLVTNVDSGDSAGAHSQGQAQLHNRG
jgi:hypothetical protein